MATLTREQWERKETADYWSSRQTVRQQMYGAVTEKMLEVAAVQSGSRVLDVAAGTGESNSYGSSAALDEEGTYWRRIILLAC